MVWVARAARVVLQIMVSDATRQKRGDWKGIVPLSAHRHFGGGRFPFFMKAGGLGLLIVTLVCDAAVQAQAVNSTTVRSIRGPGGAVTSGTILGGATKSPGDVLRHKRVRADFLLKTADRYYQENRIPSAINAYNRVIYIVGTDVTGRAAFDRLTKIHEQGMRRCDHAEQLFYDGKYVEAMDLAQEVRVRYAGVFGGRIRIENLQSVSVRAGAIERVIRDDPKARSVLESVKARQLVRHIRRLQRRAKRSQTSRVKLYKAVKLLRETYPKSSAARSYATLYAELAADEKLMERVGSDDVVRKLRGKIGLAIQYEKVGKFDRAAEIFDEIETSFPDVPKEDINALAASMREASGP